MATRVRRGKEVEIPEQWVGKFPTSKTKRQRKSKLIGKVARNTEINRYKDAKDWII